MKCCSKCKETKPFTEFNKNKSKKDGLQAHCKSCCKAARKAWYEANKERKAAIDKARYDSIKECPEYRKRKAAASRAHYAANKERHRAVQKTYYEANKEKYYAHNAKRRATVRNQTPELTELEKAKIEHVYWMAQDCRVVSGETYHVDHIHPISKGGLHHPDNLQVMHWQDNLRKGAK